MKRFLCALAVLCCCAHAAPLPEAPAQPMGFAPGRLALLDASLQQAVARGERLGAVVLVARHGRVVDWQAWGHRDMGRQEPLRRDAIFAIDTLTRPVTAAAVLMLLEEGRLSLDDKVARYLPELADAAPALTLRQLLAQTAGFAAATRLDDAADLADFTRRLGRVPLAAAPGARFADDRLCAAVAGRVVEVVSGLRLDAFLHKRLFQPLVMRDTAFVVPPAERHRLVDAAATGEGGRAVPPAEQDVVPGQRRHGWLSGADGLYSTAGDYARFAQMLLNGGELDGVRVLGRKSVELMMRNHLSHLANPTWDARASEGYGLGAGVLLDVARAARLGSTGAFGWTGGQGAQFTVDPRENLVVVLMRQHQGGAPDEADLYNLVYQALGR